MKTHLKKAALISATSLTAAAALVSTNAYAQTGPAEASEPSGEIIVTGSRIARRNVESAAPVAVVDSEEFALSGAVNVESVITTLPQVTPGTTSFSNNPGGGVATLNLRGLGSARTMVLVNGRRWMFYDTQQIVDLNTIPSFLIESVDVVTGGASAVYGSDALAGVVNFRLKDVQGLEMGAQYGVTSRGDGQRLTANFAFGGEFADGRGHATVYGEYYDRKDVFAGARKFSEDVNWDDYEGNIVPGGSATTPQGRFTSVLPTSSDDPTAQLCPTGNIFCSPGAFYETPGSSRPRTASDLYNYGPVNYLMVPQERYLMGGYADYEFSDGHTAYAEVSFVNNRVANELAATPVTGTFNIDVATASQFISAADAAAMNQLDTDGDGLVRMSVTRRTAEVGARNSLDERNAFRVLLGARGEITSNINYDAYYMFARTRNSNIQTGNVSRSAFQAGLDGTGTDINIYGPGTLTQEMVDAISITAQNTEISTLQVASGVISGSLFNTGMSRDDIGFAIGAEYRRVSSEFIPDTALSSGDVIGFNAGNPTEGAYDVKEIFGELRLPLVTDTPGIYRLELSGAVRYSDYSLGAVGGVWAYAGGIEYAPIPDVTFRGQYQRAVRAPNVQELFGGLAQGFPGATDPCSSRQPAANRTDVVRDLCIATGVPSSAVFTAAVQPNSQIQGLFGGNPNLQEETSDSWTAGVVVTPTFFPGFTATLDWYKIKVDGAIGDYGGGLSNTLNLCYNVFQDINNEYCQAIIGTRNANGIMDGENVPSILAANTGGLKVQGLDFELSYITSLGGGLLSEDARISFNFLGNYTIDNIYIPVASNPEEQYQCAGAFGNLACGTPTPKWKWTSRLSFIDGPLTTSLRWRHVGAVKDDDDTTPYAVERLSSYDQFDLTFSADVTENFSLTAGVNNLFDKQPPTMGDNQQQTNTWPGVYDVLGRDFFISGRMTF